jgi:hypothetical protein
MANLKYRFKTRSAWKVLFCSFCLASLAYTANTIAWYTHHPEHWTTGYWCSIDEEVFTDKSELYAGILCPTHRVDTLKVSVKWHHTGFREATPTVESYHESFAEAHSTEALEPEKVHKKMLYPVLLTSQELLGRYIQREKWTWSTDCNGSPAPAGEIKIKYVEHGGCGFFRAAPEEADLVIQSFDAWANSLRQNVTYETSGEYPIYKLVVISRGCGSFNGISACASGLNSFPEGK